MICLQKSSDAVFNLKSPHPSWSIPQPTSSFSYPYRLSTSSSPHPARRRPHGWRIRTMRRRIRCPVRRRQVRRRMVRIPAGARRRPTAPGVLPGPVAVLPGLGPGLAPAALLPPARRLPAAAVAPGPRTWLVARGTLATFGAMANKH